MLLFASLSQAIVYAQPIPEGGINLLDESKMANFGFQKDSLGFMRRIKDAEVQTWAVETTRQPDFIYHLSARIPLLRQPVEKGSSLLLSFEAKTEFAGLETGEARVQWVFGFSDNVKDRAEKTISVASEWKQYYVRVAVPGKLAPDALFLAVQFGYPPQRWLMRNLKIVAFPASVPIETLPRTRITYAGMEQDAPWRKAAQERIRQHRMGDLRVQFFYKNQPLENQQVQIQLSRHHFGWGAAFKAKDMGA
ncbi:MAG TPA: hypothetical protein PLL53_14745, partial [Saprospiraceae bacterium]|nr:hypothetical protein [Saprospiraceae bacterium]